jgi:hypothetical protein
MYLPYARMRFGKTAWIFSHRHLARLLERGQLLLVKQNSKYLAGALLIEGEKILFSHSLGVRDGNIDYIGKGAVTASYKFTIQWAKDQGYDWIDFGYCRPFLRDGIFVYKKRWGMALKSITRSMNMGAFGLGFCRYTRSVSTFLAKNPFVFTDQKNFKGLIVADQSHPLTSEDVQLLVRIHRIKGLDNLIVVSPHGFTHEAREMAEAQYPGFLQLASMEVEDFFEG